MPSSTAMGVRGMPGVSAESPAAHTTGFVVLYRCGATTTPFGPVSTPAVSSSRRAGRHGTARGSPQAATGGGGARSQRSRRAQGAARHVADAPIAGVIVSSVFGVALMPSAIPRMFSGRGRPAPCRVAGSPSLRPWAASSTHRWPLANTLEKITFADGWRERHELLGRAVEQLAGRQRDVGLPTAGTAIVPFRSTLRDDIRRASDRPDGQDRGRPHSRAASHRLDRTMVRQRRPPLQTRQTPGGDWPLQADTLGAGVSYRTYILLTAHAGPTAPDGA